MAQKDIDYSSIQETTPVKARPWQPPRHVYFGKKDLETGMMEEEPKYVYQEYPRMMYKMGDENIEVTVIKSDEELKALGSEWVKTPAELGYLTAPSFEQSQALTRGENPLANEQPEPVKKGKKAA